MIFPADMGRHGAPSISRAYILCHISCILVYIEQLLRQRDMDCRGTVGPWGGHDMAYRLHIRDIINVCQIGESDMWLICV